MDVLVCDRCGSRMRMLCAVHPPQSVKPWNTSISLRAHRRLPRDAAFRAFRSAAMLSVSSNHRPPRAEVCRNQNSRKWTFRKISKLRSGAECNRMIYIMKWTNWCQYRLPSVPHPQSTWVRITQSCSLIYLCLHRIRCKSWGYWYRHSSPNHQAILFSTLFILTDPPTSHEKYTCQIVCGVIISTVSFAVFGWIGAVYYLLAGVLAGNL